MIEKATSCFNRGGKRIATCSSKIKPTRRTLHSAFWTHGASDIELPPWWMGVLKNSEAAQLSKIPCSQTRYELQSSFLDFLYPPKTIRFARNISTRLRRSDEDLFKRSAARRKNGRTGQQQRRPGQNNSSHDHAKRFATIEIRGRGREPAQDYEEDFSGHEEPEPALRETVRQNILRKRFALHDVRGESILSWKGSSAEQPGRCPRSISSTVDPLEKSKPLLFEESHKPCDGKGTSQAFDARLEPPINSSDPGDIGSTVSRREVDTLPPVDFIKLEAFDEASTRQELTNKPPSTEMSVPTTICRLFKSLPMEISSNHHNPDQANTELEFSKTAKHAEIMAAADAYESFDPLEVNDLGDLKDLDQARIDQAIDQAMFDTVTVESRVNSDLRAQVGYWSERSQELGRAFETYLDSLDATNAISGSEDDYLFASSEPEMLIIAKHIKDTSYAAGNFLDVLLYYLQKEVFPSNRARWSEKQWAFFISLLFIRPRRPFSFATDSDTEKLGFTTGRHGFSGILTEACKYIEPLALSRDLFKLAIALCQDDMAASLLVFCRTQEVGVNSALSGIEVRPPVLARWNTELIERVQIPRQFVDLEDDFVRSKSDRKICLDLAYLLTERLLQQKITLDLNVATYEKAWATFSCCERLCNKHFILALNQLNVVEWTDPSELTAFVEAGYKIFCAASKRSDFAWNEVQARKFLQRMAITRHPQCWAVFLYYRQNFGFHSEVHKTLMKYLSDAGEVQHWEEVFTELQANEDIDKFEWMHQLLIAYSKHANVKACKTVFKSMETESGRFPDLTSWNAVLHAYLQANNVTGAFKFCRYMRRRGVKQDISTTMEILRGYASRGEYKRASGLVARTRVERHELQAQVARHLVNASLNKQDMETAERLLNNTFDLPASNSITDAWNAVLTQYAHQRKMADMIYIRGRMLEHGLKDNGNTYAALMLGFAHEGDIYAVGKIMSESMPRHNVVPTILHYNLLLHAQISREMYKTALRTYGSLKDLHIEPDAIAYELALRALAAIDNITEEERESLRARVLPVIEIRKSPREELGAKIVNSIISKYPMIGQDSQAVDQALASLRETGKTVWTDEQREAYITKHRIVHTEPHLSQDINPQIHNIAATAEAYSSDMNYTAIDNLWQQARDSLTTFARRTKALAKRQNYILYSRETLLGPIFHQYMVSLIKRNQGVLLDQTIKDLTRAGWCLPSSTWETYVIFLAKCGNVQLAFQYAEQYLADQFTGCSRGTEPGVKTSCFAGSLSPGQRKWTVQRPACRTLVYLEYAYTIWRREHASNDRRHEMLAELWNAAPRTLNYLSLMPDVDPITQRLLQKHHGNKDVRHEGAETQAEDLEHLSDTEWLSVQGEDDGDSVESVDGLADIDGTNWTMLEDEEERVQREAVHTV